MYHGLGVADTASPPMKRARGQDGAPESQSARDMWEAGMNGSWHHWIDGKETGDTVNMLHSPFDGTPVCSVALGDKTVLVFV